MSVLEIKVLEFPSLKDPDLDDSPILFQLDWNGAENFVTGKFPRFIIRPLSNDTDPGEYLVNITVRDDNPLINFVSY